MYPSYPLSARRLARIAGIFLDRSVRPEAGPFFLERKSGISRSVARFVVQRSFLCLFPGLVWLFDFMAIRTMSEREE